MELRLIASTPDIERLIATAILTTTGFQPSNAYRMLLNRPERVRRIVERLEMHHGSVFEHNRLCWLLEARSEEVLELLLRCRFFQLTRLEESKWLMSANIRTLIEYVKKYDDFLARALIESIIEIAPTIYKLLRGD